MIHSLDVIQSVCLELTDLRTSAGQVCDSLACFECVEADIDDVTEIKSTEDLKRLVADLVFTNVNLQTAAAILDLDESRWPPRQSQWYINARKDEGQRPQHIEHKGDPYHRQQIDIYQAYEELCQRSGLVDFAELLLRAHELWRDRPDILQHYQQRFSHVLVDEFQDTNKLQMDLLHKVLGPEGNIVAVGDEDLVGLRRAGARTHRRYR